MIIFLQFEAAMFDIGKTTACEKQCLPNCEETVYDYSVSTAELNLDALCAANTQTREV